MKKFLLFFCACLTFVYVLCSQDKVFFGIVKENQLIQKEKDYQYILSSNNYYHSYDGCDIFVDNLCLDESDGPGVNAVFLIEPSLSIGIQKMIYDLQIVRADIVLSFICLDDSTASINVSDVTFRDKENTNYENKQISNKLKESVKNKRAKILLRRNNRQVYSCGLLFTKKN